MQYTFGVLAHVDAGKTTFSEQLLKITGVLRNAGRVDNGNTYMDHDPIEIRRGITVFSDQTMFSYQGIDFCFIDTPGHADFACEMLRSLSVLDAAILLVSAVDGIQGQTAAIWQYLRKLHIPTMVFINKTDLVNADADTVLSSMQKRFSENILDFSEYKTSEIPTHFLETIAACDEAMLDAYLTDGDNITLMQNHIRTMFLKETIFPCFRGSALRNDGVKAFLDAFITLLTKKDSNPNALPSGIIYKIRSDKRNGRLHFLKLTSGVLRVRDEIEGIKINRILRPYGEKYEAVDQINTGDLAAVTLSQQLPCGTCFGDYRPPYTVNITPALQTRVIYPETIGIAEMEQILKELEAEEPALHVEKQNDALHIAVMGSVQLDVLKELIAGRYGISIDFGKCSILYRETIKAPIKGYGHFEPLRHYAEVHVLLSPNNGQGIRFENAVHTDILSQNYINLVRTHVYEKEHKGVLTGSPLTDVTVTLTAGRAHLKHTEGGDFRESTYRAIRQGLEKADNVLLEPYYRFSIVVQPELVGRVLTDITRFGGSFDDPETIGEQTVITGTAPVSEIMDYPLEIASLSRGLGSVFFSFDGYRPCHNTEEVIESIGYDRTRDNDNPSCSVFCAKGAGFNVPWYEVEDYIHIKE